MTQVASAILERKESTDNGTFGIFTFNNFTCFSGELRWNANQSNISCIPKGVYNCHWTYSPKFKKKVYLIDCDTRQGIRIHSANFMGDDSKGFKKQLHGCVALGEKLGTMDRQKALLLSRPAVRKFEDLMKGRDFILEIK